MAGVGHRPGARPRSGRDPSAPRLLHARDVRLNRRHTARALCPRRQSHQKPGGAQRPKRDAFQNGPADVIPFGPPAPRTPADPPTAATVVGGRVTKRRTLSPGLSMTLSINVAELARALLDLEEARGSERKNRPPRRRT